MDIEGVPGLERVQARFVRKWSSTLRRRVSGSLSPSVPRVATAKRRYLNKVTELCRFTPLGCASDVFGLHRASIYVTTSGQSLQFRPRLATRREESTRHGPVHSARPFDMRPDKKRASLDPLFPPGRLVFVETRVLQRPGNTAREMPTRLRPTRRSERTVGNNRSDTRHEYTNRRNQMRAELAETRAAVAESSISDPGDAPDACASAAFIVSAFAQRSRPARAQCQAFADLSPHRRRRRLSSKSAITQEHAASGSTTLIQNAKCKRSSTQANAATCEPCCSDQNFAASCRHFAVFACLAFRISHFASVTSCIRPGRVA